MIVDMRLRPPLKSWVDKPQFSRGAKAGYYPSRIGFPRPPSAEQQSIELLLQEMDTAGIQWGVIMGRQSAAPLGVIPNDEIAELIVQHPDRFVSFAGIDVSADPETSLAEIDRCLALPGFKGISLEPGASSTPMTTDDARLYPIYEHCRDRGVPVSITLSGMLGQMVGASWEVNHPQPLYKTAKDFPDLQIVISHAAWPYVQEMLGVAFVCGNVWVSPDLYMVGTNTPGAAEYVKAANFLPFGPRPVRHGLPQPAARRKRGGLQRLDLRTRRKRDGPRPERTPTDAHGRLNALTRSVGNTQSAVMQCH